MKNLLITLLGSLTLVAGLPACAALDAQPTEQARLAGQGDIMNPHLVGGLAFSAALPAQAGPDWQLIEHGRAVKQAAARAADDTQSTTQTQTSIHRSPSRLVLPLDHGPRAQTTPRANQVRVRQYEAQLNTGVASN